MSKVRVVREAEVKFDKNKDIIEINGFKVPTFFEVDEYGDDVYRGCYFNNDDMRKCIKNTCFDQLDSCYGRLRDKKGNIRIETEKFLIWNNRDEFYIYYKPSGLCINWYKFVHIGRCNHCNKPGITIAHLQKLCEVLRDDLNNC